MHLWNRSLLVLLFVPTMSWAEVDFEKEVAPLLIKRCLGCHNPSEVRGGLDLTKREHLPEEGKPLLEKVQAGEMPPPLQGKSQKLAEREMAIIQTWIKAGSPWPKDRVLDLYEFTTEVRAGRDWWSLQPIVPGIVPKIPEQQTIRNPIDAFILKKQLSMGLTLAPKADRRTLLRRLWYDLVGLPPPIEEIEAFVQDTSDYAYEQRVEKLLQSPQHGERWARYWLDLVRYADTNGYERDAPKPNAWKYRDYVIQSINKDKPFDQFLIEQLAGDELPNRTEETLIATGMLRVGTWDDEPNDKLEYKYDRLEDMVHVTATAFLGMTVKCARCHDHKFDPIPQTDYYRFAAAFWPGDLVGNPTDKVDGYDVLAWTDKTVPPEPLKLLKKGDPRRPLQEVQPGFLSALPKLNEPFVPVHKEAKSSLRRLQLAKRMADPSNPLTARVLVNRVWQQHFGQGLVRTADYFGFKGDLPSHPELLDWLAHDFVNHGWSVKHLHRMIVLSDTYKQASIHPDPELGNRKDAGNRLLWHANRRRLDAEALRDSLLTVSGQLNAKMGGPGFTPKVTKEALEGLSKKSAAWKESTVEEQRRRAVYMFHQRSFIPPLMTTFDFCDTTRPCAQRDVTIVAPQALTLFNNEFVHEQSEAVAKRILANHPEQPIQAAWRILLGREAKPHEIELAQQHLKKMHMHLNDQPKHMPLTSLCHVLINTNEFLYVD